MERTRNIYVLSEPLIPVGTGASTRVFPCYVWVLPRSQLASVFFGMWVVGMLPCVWFHLRGEQMDSYRALNKEDCSSERALLSNKCRISWMVAKPEQVFYRLVGTHFPTSWRCPRVRRWKNSCYHGNCKRQHVPETDQVGSPLTRSRMGQEVSLSANPLSLSVQAPGHFCKLLSLLRDPKA